MFIRRQRGWAERRRHSGHIFFNQRRAAATGGLAVTPCWAPVFGPANADDTASPSAGLYPVKRNRLYKLDRAVTGRICRPVTIITTNSTPKGCGGTGSSLPIRAPGRHRRRAGGKTQQFAIDDLLGQMPSRTALPPPLRRDLGDGGAPPGRFAEGPDEGLSSPRPAPSLCASSFLLPDIAAAPAGRLVSLALCRGA